MKTQFIFEALPKDIKKKYQAFIGFNELELKIDEEFVDDLRKLEKKYENKYKKLFKPFSTFSSKKSDFEVSENENQVEDENNVIRSDASFEVEFKANYSFWKELFNKSPVIRERIEKHDEPILKYLIGIKFWQNIHKLNSSLIVVKTIELIFSSNEFFENHVLKKIFVFNESITQQIPIDCNQFYIIWKNGKNVSVEGVVNDSNCIAIKKRVKTSFFDFFGSNKQNVSEDWTLGQKLFDLVLPKSVLSCLTTSNQIV